MADTELVRKSVVFIGFQMANGDKRFAGSAFLVRLQDPPDPRIAPGVLVTAKHVIDGIRALGIDEVLVRYNTADGRSFWEAYAIAQWKSDQTATDLDVAFLHIGDIPQGLDHLYIPSGLFASQHRLEQHGVMPGEEIFMVGLFNRHIGRTRNIPIVRVGNLACLDEEKVMSRIGEIDAYLIEARSLGGLSGSPVFIDLDRPRMNQTRRAREGEQHGLLLLGLIHGHYDEPQDVGAQTPRSISVNAGIAFVVPTKSISAAMAPYLAEQAAIAPQVRIANPYFAPILRRRRVED